MKLPDRWVAVGWMMMCAQLLSSCGSSIRMERGLAPKELKPIHSIAVLSFNNYSDTRDAGRIVASQAGRVWAERASSMQIIDFETAERRLAEKYIQMPARIDRAKAIELGSVLAADAVLVGSVLEFGTIRRAGRRVVVKEPVVGLQVRLIRVDDGLVYWSGIMARESDSLIVPSRETPEDLSKKTLSELFQSYVPR